MRWRRTERSGRLGWGDIVNVGGADLSLGTMIDDAVRVYPPHGLSRRIEVNKVLVGFEPGTQESFLKRTDSGEMHMFLFEIPGQVSGSGTGCPAIYPGPFVHAFAFMLFEAPREGAA
jgi:hypothetical protein